MRWSLTIAKVAGIPIRVHASFLLLVLLVASSASRLHSTSEVVTYIVWLVLLFVSVTVHELSHSVVAKRLGLTVRDIVLLPIGGVSQIEGMGTSAAIEGKVAIAGPLSSLVIGGVFLGIAAATGTHVWPPSLDINAGTWLSRIGWLNLALAAFNLLPALPMDGGRVFRSVLSRFVDGVRATRIASGLAAVLAVVMGVVGYREGDFLLILIAVFVFLGAMSERQSAQMQRTFEGLVVGSFMYADGTTVPASVPVEQVAGWLAHYPGRAVPVVDDAGRYLGIVDHGDLAVLGPGTPVGSAADRTAPLLAPTMDLVPAAVQAFQASHRQDLAVADNGRVIGVLYLPAVTAALMRARRPVATAGRV